MSNSLAALLGTDAHGTPPDAMQRGTEQLGLHADARDGMTLDDLRAALRAGSPVICAVQASGDGDTSDRGHWVTVYGVDDAGSVYIMDPEVGRKRIGRELWEARWHDISASGERFDHWGLILSKPVAKSSSAPIRKSADSADYDPVQTAELIADILGGLLGDGALEAFPTTEAEAEGKPEGKAFAGILKGTWDPLKHPRGAGGRFIPKGSAEAVAAAREGIDGIRKLGEGARDPEQVKALANHLSILTVKQLHELKKEYGLKASGKVRDELVAKILDRLPGAQKRIDAERAAAAEQLGLPAEATMRDIVAHIAADAGHPLTQEELSERLDALGVSVPVQRGEAVREALALLQEKEKPEAKPGERPTATGLHGQRFEAFAPGEELHPKETLYTAAGVGSAQEVFAKPGDKLEVVETYANGTVRVRREDGAESVQAPGRFAEWGKPREKPEEKPAPSEPTPEPQPLTASDLRARESGKPNPAKKPAMPSVQVSKPEKIPTSDGSYHANVYADKNGERVGTLTLGENPRRNSLFVDNVDVSEDHRRQGISTQLHSEAFREAQEQGKTLESGILATPENQAFWEHQRELGNAERFRIDHDTGKLVPDPDGPFSRTSTRYVMTRDPAEGKAV